MRKRAGSSPVIRTSREPRHAIRVVEVLLFYGLHLAFKCVRNILLYMFYLRVESLALFGIRVRPNRLWKYLTTIIAQTILISFHNTYPNKHKSEPSLRGGLGFLVYAVNLF